MRLETEEDALAATSWLRPRLRGVRYWDETGKTKQKQTRPDSSIKCMMWRFHEYWNPTTVMKHYNIQAPDLYL